MGILLLASLSVAATAESELDMLAAYLQPYDEPAVQGDHCRRSGGIEAGTAAGELEVPATNRHLLRHRLWHDAASEGRVIDDAFRDENNTYGTEFREYHRDMVFSYAAWREDHGLPPLGVWDPATPIPPEFTNPDALPREVMNSDTDARIIAVFVQCLAHETEDPNVSVPSWATIVGGSTPDPVFGYRALCDFPTLNALGKAIDSSGEGFHSNVHATVAGDLAPPWTSPRDPLFHPWHHFLELSVFSAWESECQKPPAGPQPDPGSTRGLPAATASLIVLALACAALAAGARLRRRRDP
jgi:hypothetical protein